MFAGDAAGTINNHPDSEAGFSALYGHCVFLPDGYSSTGPLLPLIVSLGGVGERGNGDSELASVRRAGPLGYIDQNAAVRTYLGTTKPCIVLSWQIPAGTNYSIGDTEEMISYAIATYRVDPRRIHLTGLSLGGGHAWKYAVAMPDRIASLVPVCGSSGPTNQEGVAELGKLPIWAHHNAGDTLVIAKDTSFPWCRQAAQGRGGTAEPSPILSFPYALDSPSGRPTYTGHYGPSTGWVWFNGVSSSFGADRPLLTIYPAVGHGGWDAAYSATGTYAWMQGQAPNPTELVIDNRSSKQISASGAWARTTGGGGCYGGDATRLPANSASGSFTFQPTFQRRAIYQVQMRWPTLSTQSASLPVSVVHSGGTAQVQVNQSINGGLWNTLGSWTFAAGSGSSVTIQGSNLGGIAAADAVRFILSNQSPIVAAGSDLSVAYPATASLSGSASDDGVPGALTYAWSQVSGPGTTAFSAADKPTCTASFDQPGTYVLRLTASDGQLSASDDLQVTVSATTGSGNAISREWWNNIDGSIVATIPLASPPSGTGSLPSFEAPSNWGENYGQRVRGFLVAPTTGAYVFWIASDNNSELWLSSDASASKRSKIASVSGWAPPRSWLVMPSQKSAPVNLVAGTTYYIEALHKEGGGGDSLAVGWSRPGQSTATASEVIPGAVLRPWKANAAPTVSAGGDVGTVLGGSARLSGAATDDGQPTGSTLATTWTLVSGPGTVTWADASLAATTAAFSAIGSYTLRLTASDGERSSSDDVVVTVETPGITRDYWLGLSDTTSVAGIPRLTASSGSEILSSYEAPTNWASNYGQIVRGQLVAPVSGSYTFWIAGDNNCELWLSSSSDPAARVRIASVTGWTLPRQWGKYTSQRSVAITLSAGSRYYIEALHIESGGGDCLGVGWSKPGEATSTASEIIPGAVLRPYVPSGGG